MLLYPWLWIAALGASLMIAGGFSLCAFANASARRRFEKTLKPAEKLAFDAWRGAAAWEDYATVLAAERQSAAKKSGFSTAVKKY